MPRSQSSTTAPSFSSLFLVQVTIFTTSSLLCGHAETDWMVIASFNVAIYLFLFSSIWLYKRRLKYMNSNTPHPLEAYNELSFAQPSPYAKHNKMVMMQETPFKNNLWQPHLTCHKKSSTERMHGRKISFAQNASKFYTD